LQSAASLVPGPVREIQVVMESQSEPTSGSSAERGLVVDYAWLLALRLEWQWAPQ
jgi:hypothetical protein